MRQRKYLAVCTAAMLLLTGCGGNGTKKRETDLSQRYPDYFKYCFGEDAKFSFDSSYKGLDSYELTYHDHTGVLRERTVTVPQYDPERESANYSTKEEYYNSRMISCVADEMERVAWFGFAHDVLEPNLKGHLQDNGFWRCDTERYMLVANFQEIVGEKRVADERLKVGSGWQVCTADWKTVVSDELEYVVISVTISPDADAADYKERFTKVVNEYLTCTDQPKTVNMSLRQTTDSEHESRVILEKNVVLGTARSTDANARAYMLDELEEKYSS